MYILSFFALNVNMYPKKCINVNFQPSVIAFLHFRLYPQKKHAFFVDINKIGEFCILA